MQIQQLFYRIRLLMFHQNNINFKTQGLKSKSSSHQLTGVILPRQSHGVTHRVLHALVCWVDFCTRVRGAMEIRGVWEGFAVALPAWRRAVTPFPGPHSLCLPCQRQPGLVWLLSSPRYHLQLLVLCLLLIVYWNNVIIPLCILPDLCNGPLGFLALVRFSLNFRVRAGLCGSRNTESKFVC